MQSLDINFLHRLVCELDLERFFHMAAAGLAAQFAADGAALIVCEEPDRLRYQFFHGLPAAHQRLATHAFSNRLGVAGAALAARRPILVTNYADSPYAMPAYVACGLKASLCSPVVADGRVLAILAISWFCQSPPLPDAADYRMLAIVSDFMGTALHRFHTEQRLRTLALHDPLTGAANRNLFFDRLPRAMATAVRHERLVAIIVFDIDNFRMINDRLGHAMGDSLLVEIKRRVQDLIRTGDTLARLGGDEFALILEDVNRYSEIETVIERIRQTSGIRWGTNTTQIAVSISLGFTVYPIEDGPESTLLHHADIAMHEAKRAGGNRGLVFTDAMALSRDPQSDLVLQFGHAIEQGEMILYFQPVVDLLTGETVSAEALIRWQHPTHGLLAPPQFMAAMEHAYNSLKLDAWVIRAALAALARWQARGIFRTLHINLSASSVENHRFGDTVRRALAASEQAVDPRYLGIELVEWSTIRDLDAARALIDDCRRLGIAVALDDFGTGYAALQHLRSLPIDTIKIDKSFIAGITYDRADCVLVQSMISAAEAFGITPVAEGIETPAQRAVLLTMGCRFGQGYLFAPPGPEAQLWGPDDRGCAGDSHGESLPAPTGHPGARPL